jgi:hypothetical protein
MMAKSVVFDFADDWGGGQVYMGIRRIEFTLNGAVIPMTTGFVAYTTTMYSGYLPAHSFTTSLSKIGSWSGAMWVSANGYNANQRLIIVFNTPIEFETIVINNAHHLGGYTGEGVKNAKITISPDAITSTVYGDTVPNGVLIFDNVFPQHVAGDVVDDRVVFDYALLKSLSGNILSSGVPPSRRVLIYKNTETSPATSALSDANTGNWSATVIAEEGDKFRVLMIGEGDEHSKVFENVIAG